MTSATDNRGIVATRAQPSRSSGESDITVGETLRGVVMVVGALVVMMAEQEPSSRSVGPPRAQVSQWWASHQVPGMSQPSARQVLSRSSIALRWRG
jgi:hypothetical protein